MEYKTVQPYSTSYEDVGSKSKPTRDVIGVLCPRPVSYLLFGVEPIFVHLGDAKVDWSMPQSAGYKAVFTSK